MKSWKSPNKARRARRISVAVAVVSALVAFFGANNRVVGAPAVAPPRFPVDTPTGQEERDREEFWSSFPGTIIFDTTRSGTFGIYRLSAHGSEAQVLIDTPAQEMHPAPAPDGSWIAYSRAEQNDRWAPLELWRVDIDGSNPKRLAAHGGFPTVSADGKRIFYLRDYRTLHELDLETGESKRLFPRKEHRFGKHIIVVPRFTPDGSRVVFASTKGERWTIWMADLSTGKYRRIGNGCQPDWMPANDGVFWVTSRGMLERTGVVSRMLKEPAGRTLVDLDAPRGHEYFPSMTPDSRYVLYSAASPGQHDHIDSDYQLFAKELQTGKVTRLSFDGYNNRWPRPLNYAPEEKRPEPEEEIRETRDEGGASAARTAG